MPDMPLINYQSGRLKAALKVSRLISKLALRLLSMTRY